MGSLTKYSEVSHINVLFTLQVLENACNDHNGFTVLNKLKWIKSKMLYKV